MAPNVSQYDALDRQVLFRNTHEQLMRKAESCVRGQNLFGITPLALDGMAQVGQQLELLQRLYGLFSTVNRALERYDYIEWAELNLIRIEERFAEYLQR